MTTLKVLEHMTIVKDEYYNCFPSIVKLADGTIRLGYRQAPDRMPNYSFSPHVDPSSKAVSIHSTNGINWSMKKDVIWDDFFQGVQDPCLNVLQDGTLFATFFTWKVYDKDETPPDLDVNKCNPLLGRWLGISTGTHTIRSVDGGKTWDTPIHVIWNNESANNKVAMRGNSVEIDDGSILTPFYGRSDEDTERSDVFIGRTTERGQTWEKAAVLSSESGEYQFHEPNLYKTASGKLILFIRSEKRASEPGETHLASPLFTAESLDNGKTWTKPVMWSIYSPSPFHLLRLSDGQVLLSYAYRMEPYGIRALILDEECSNLATAEEMILRDDGPGFDIGYTSAVQLEDGRILIVYYYFDDEVNYHRYIAGTLCQLE